MKEVIEATLTKRLKTLIAIRALFVTALLGSFFLFEIGYSIFPYPSIVLHLIVFLYIMTIVYSFFLGRVRGHILAYSQICIDTASVMALIFLTGGIESWFSPLMLLVVLAAPIVLDKKAGYFTAVLAGILYGSLIDLQFYGILPIPYDTMLLERDFLYNIFSHLMALFLTAYLTGYLSSRLEKTSERLEEKDTNLRDLTLFNEEVIENIPSGLFTTDIEGRILLFNRAAEGIMKIKRGDAIGRDITAVFPFVNPLREKVHSEETMKAGGSTRVIGLTVSKMKDIKGQDTGFIGIFKDLTQLKILEREMKKKEQLAAIGELSANIAHEIRNPLASLKGAIEIIKEDSIPRGQKEHLMEIALSEMDRLNTIVTEFLSFSRPKSLEPVHMDLSQTLKETAELLAKRDAGNISIKTNFPDGLFIEADPMKLQQVFWNLGINAIEAMPGGGELSIAAEVKDDHVEITFGDTGGGIPDKDIERIFYPFYTTKSNGTGLGLSIAYRIIEDHEGKIRVSDTSTRGATFEITLPVKA
jgi:two-component system sensor histidine kinase PilS (NtrC family)